MAVSARRAERLGKRHPSLGRYTWLMLAKKRKRLINDNASFDMATERIAVYAQGVSREGRSGGEDAGALLQ